MDYEKKYKELVGKIEKAYLYAQTDSTKAVLEEIHPELKESEDEEIRQAMINFFKSERIKDGIAVLHFGVNIEKMIAWLEKKGKPKWTEEDDANVHCCISKVESDIANGYLGGNKELIEWLKSLKQRMGE